MREKIYNILIKIYGILMTIAFFAGFLPIILFIIAIIIGGNIGETVALFLYKNYYAYVIAIASIAIILGWIAMYFGKKEGLSIKSIDNKNDKVK